LELPLSGSPEQKIYDGNPVQTVAVLGNEYVGMRPTMLVEEGQRVKLGEALFSDKKNPGVLFTAPGAGTVKAINRGAKRALQSVVIELDGDEEEESFAAYSSEAINSLNIEDIKKNLVDSGLWVAFRTRPYSRSPAIDSTAHSIFVTAMDTNPLATDPSVVINEYADDYKNGLTVLSQLTEGKVFICQAPDAALPVCEASNVEVHTFSGPHPAGLAGTHIHYLDPVSAQKTVWTINYQDVIAIGKLFTTGKLWVERIVSFAGPLVLQPRLIRTRLGASTEDLAKGQLEAVQARIISGSVLQGHTANNWAGYLGRFHTQISVIAESVEREFMGWIRPGGKDKFFILNVFIFSLFF
jgi:Na+-transporting NADH:ubiquinone oxidoreductase subunit A